MRTPVFSAIKTYFISQFGSPEVSLRAPGRINIIGEHTDYGLGYVLPSAINRYTYFVASKSQEAQHKIQAYNLDQQIVLDTDNDTLTTGWERYIEAVFIILRRADYILPPCHIVFGGDIPMGAGMSSSTALSSGCIYALSELNDLQLSKEKIALLSQQAEHLVGAKGGLMDQYAILFSEKGYAIKLDCLTLTKTMIPIQLEGASFSLINSNIPHDFSTSDAYNDRRRVCERALSQLQAKYPNIDRLSDMTIHHLAGLRDVLDEADFSKIKYVYEENKRVHQVAEYLLHNDIKSIGTCLQSTHHGLSQQYQVSLPEIDILVDIANTQEGIYGARMMGGGFGGSVLILGEDKTMQSYLQHILTAYYDKTHIQGEIINVELSNGIELINL
jgi:galactokinase